MENRYSRLSKDKKKKVRDTFRDTKKGRELKPILDRLFCECIFLVICFAVMTPIGIINHNTTWYYWAIDILSAIFSVVFFIAQYKIRIEQYCIVANKFNIR